MKIISLVFFLGFFLVGCDSLQQRKLVGKWQAAQVLEDGLPMQVDAGNINFEFSSNGNYHFNSTLNYKESGTYSVRGDLLYTMDTINKASSEKAVKILTLNEDSLFLLMNAEGKERIVKLFKTQRK